MYDRRQPPIPADPEVRIRLSGIAFDVEVHEVNAMLYSAGDCPVCADSGALIGLRARNTGRLFLLCPLCGVAFTTRPKGLDEILSIEDVAPTGVELPSLRELAGSSLAPFEEAPQVWLRYLDL